MSCKPVSASFTVGIMPSPGLLTLFLQSYLGNKCIALQHLCFLKETRDRSFMLDLSVSWKDVYFAPFPASLLKCGLQLSRLTSVLGSQSPASFDLLSFPCSCGLLPIPTWNKMNRETSVTLCSWGNCKCCSFTHDVDVLHFKELSSL